jgi:hypothetical protein
MHPILSQALAAERAREWEDRAARYRLAKQLQRARRQAARVAAELPGPRGGSRQPAPRPVVPAPAAPTGNARGERVGVASGQPAEGDRQPVGRRAA